MSTIRWDRYPLVFQNPLAKAWLQLQECLAQNTIEAYGRALNDFLAFCSRHVDQPTSAQKEVIALYVKDLCSRPNPRLKNIHPLNQGHGLANATLQQKLTVIRLFFDFLIEEGVRETNPVGRGRYTPGRSFSGKRERGLIPRFRKQPWIPSDDQWRAIIAATKQESIRNRAMLALSYDAGLRREELCALQVGDIDPALRLVRVRAETTKNKQGRTVPFSQPTGQLLSTYLRRRKLMNRDQEAVFLSESRRNRAQPLSVWSWSKIVAGIASRSSVGQFTTHTARHLCLTDRLAVNRRGDAVGVHEVADPWWTPPQCRMTSYGSRTGLST